MNENEKKQFVSEQAEKVLGKFGHGTDDKVSEKGLILIRDLVDHYVKRQSLPKSESCENVFRSDLGSVLLRGSKYVKTINDEFSSQTLVPQSGIYIAMIESEFCPCLKSPTGAAGIFQLTTANSNKYELKNNKDAASQKPDAQCNLQSSSRAAAKYMKYMIVNKFDNQMDSVGYLLAVSSYNRGEDLTQKHMQAVSAFNGNQKVKFWDFLDADDKIVAKGNPMVLNQFRAENKT